MSKGGGGEASCILERRRQTLCDITGMVLLPRSFLSFDLMRKSSLYNNISEIQNIFVL